MASSQRVLAIAVIVAVGLAFADASIVALALAELYAEFDTTVVGVSWVLTSYALAVAASAVPVALLHRRASPRVLVAGGAAVFAVASVVAGSASTLPMLLGARCLQGIAATALLAGSLPALGALVGHTRARRWWARAGAAGAAAGPALGGLLTQLFDWRAIFFVQAPIAAAAVLVVRDTRPAPPDTPPDPAPRRRGDVAIANAGFALLFAALVAALFLGVLLVIEVWRYSPLTAALLVSALPAGMLGASLAMAAPRGWRALGGVVLAMGLVGLALVPGERPVSAAISLALCGAGFELMHSVLDDAAVADDHHAARAAAVSVGARHAGLVVGLLLIAPALSTSITAGIDRATLGATSTLLDSDLRLQDKLAITWDLRSAIDDARRGEVPDLEATFDERGAESGNDLARARDALIDTVTDAMTRAFRPAFAIAAGLAALAIVPGLALASHGDTPATRRRRRQATLAVGAAAIVGLGVIGTMMAQGADDVGEFTAQDPCTADPDPFPGGGLDAAVQRIALSALNGAACDLGTTREVLVLSLDDDSGYGDVTWDDDTVESALRVGAHRAIDDARARDDISGITATVLRVAADRAPLQWLIDGVPSLL